MSSIGFTGTLMCPHWPGCGCGTQSGPHTCEWEQEQRERQRQLELPLRRGRRPQRCGGDGRPRDDGRMLEALRNAHPELTPPPTSKR